METLDNKVLHLVMYVSTKSDVSFQTAGAFAVILSASLLPTYFNVAGVCEQQSKSELKTFICLSFGFYLSPIHQNLRDNKKQ